MSKEKVTIVGSGLAGSLLTGYLAKKGYQVQLYEKRSDPRLDKHNAITGSGKRQGRSINLAMSVRGIRGLQELGLTNQVKSIAIPMTGRMLHGLDGSTKEQSYSKDNSNCLFSISRGGLNDILISFAESFPNVDIQFNKAISKIDTRNGQLYFKDKTPQQVDEEQRVIIACDGSFSKIRSSLQKLPRYNYSQEFLNHGYKELSIPPNQEGKHQMKTNYLHIWPRGAFMMIALPNQDGSFTCTVFMPFDEEKGGESSFSYLNSKERVNNFFQRMFPDALLLMPTLWEDWQENPHYPLVTIRCWPWTYHSTKVDVALLGDAAHAIVPFYGQGMNAAFEDCYYLNQCIEKHRTENKTDWVSTFKEYQQMRKRNTDAIAEMAVDNFIEMMDKTADEAFLFRKKVEHFLELQFPGRYVSQYELVSFSHTPYAEAQEIGGKNNLLLAELISTTSSQDLSKIDLQLADRLIQKYLNK